MRLHLALALARRSAQVLLVVIAVTACEGQRSADGSDGAAVAACRHVLGQVADSQQLATTVREAGLGLFIRGWSSHQAQGEPDFLCRVARDEAAPGGVRVAEVASTDGHSGYSSRLDIEFDNGA